MHHSWLQAQRSASSMERSIHQCFHSRMDTRGYPSALTWGVPCIPTNVRLFGGFNLPLWKMMDFVSWDDDQQIPNCFWKVIIHSWFQSPPTSRIVLDTKNSSGNWLENTWNILNPPERWILTLPELHTSTMSPGTCAVERLERNQWWDTPWRCRGTYLDVIHLTCELLQGVDDLQNGLHGCNSGDFQPGVTWSHTQKWLD